MVEFFPTQVIPLEFITPAIILYLLLEGLQTTDPSVPVTPVNKSWLLILQLQPVGPKSSVAIDGHAFGEHVGIVLHVELVVPFA